jgi:hypothetical protein
MSDQGDSRAETTPQPENKEPTRFSFKIDVSGASKDDLDQQISQFGDDLDQQIAQTQHDPVRTRLLEAARAALNNVPQQSSEVAGYMLGGVFEHGDAHLDFNHTDAPHDDLVINIPHPRIY